MARRGTRIALCKLKRSRAVFPRRLRRNFDLGEDRGIGRQGDVRHSILLATNDREARGCSGWW